MTAAVMFSTPNHKMVASHHYMGDDFTPSRLNDSFLQKVICSTPNFAPSTPITPSSVAHTTSVSKYVNMGTIGEGSYGLVLKCKERQTGRIVAIKKFIESEEDKSVRKIAMREIHLLKQLRHENLVNLLEVFRRKSRLYLVFEFVEKSLLDHLELSPNGLERGHCRRILYQVIRALEFCHIHNIIHRDVKPENILISKHGVVKLCDFGFARTLAKPGEIYTEYVSTRWYRAPELLVGDARYGRAVDIWALGCLSAEMMTGQPLFPGDSDIDQLFSIVKCFGGLCTRHEDRLYSNPMFRFEISQIEVTEPLKCRIRGCSSREFQFVASCLELDPQDRPTCSALLRHPLFTCDGFTSWFPDELEEMLRRDADEHKLPTEAPKPKRLLPDLKKCILLNSSTPIKGSSTHPVNLFAQPTNHHQPPNSYNDCPQEKAATTHRNLEKAFGNCVANDDHDDDDDDDVKSPHNDSGHDDDERFNFDLRPQDTYDLQLPDSSAISDLDLSFSHLGIREGVELEGEESPRKLMNINEDCGDDDDYEEAANGIYNYAHHDDDDVYDNSNKQHPVSVQPLNHKDDYNKNNDYNNNNKNNYNNNNKGKQLSSSKIKSLSSSSSSSSSSAMTSLPSSSSSSASSKKSSASTSGVSSPSSSSSTSSLNNNNHHHYQQHKNNYHYNKNNYSSINNNNYNNNNNYYYYNHNKTGANNNSNTNNVQSHKSSFDANHKSQNQKFPQHSTSKNYKSQQQDQTRTQHKPLQPLQQKNNNQQNNQQQQQYNQQQKNNIHKQQQQQHHYKQAENESPKPVQRSTQQQQHKQQQQQKFQHPQKQQNFQSKPAKKKSNIDACKPPQKQTAPKFSTNQSKIGFKHS